MNTFLSLLLQCGAFLLVPALVFGVGLWLINKFVGTEDPKSLIAIAAIIGFSFFAAAVVGMLIDPRGGFSKMSEIIKTAGIIGIVVSLSILVFVPIYRRIVKRIKS